MTQPSPRARIQVATLLVAAGLLVPTPPAQAGTLYGFSDVFNQVYAIDTATGAATLVGTLPPVDNMAGIAFDDEGVLHGVMINFTGDMELWQLDPGATSTTFVGLTGDNAVEGGLVYDPTADLFYSKWGASAGATARSSSPSSPTRASARSSATWGSGLSAT
jgi:hypothetical protein